MIFYTLRPSCDTFRMRRSSVVLPRQGEYIMLADKGYRVDMILHHMDGSNHEIMVYINPLTEPWKLEKV